MQNGIISDMETGKIIANLIGAKVGHIFAMLDAFLAKNKMQAILK